VFPSTGYWSRSQAAPDDVAFERWVRGLLSGPARLGVYPETPRHEIERVTYEEIDE
jgi:hypothetical protein